MRSLVHVDAGPGPVDLTVGQIATRIPNFVLARSESDQGPGIPESHAPIGKIRIHDALMLRCPFVVEIVATQPNGDWRQRRWNLAVDAQGARMRERGRGVEKASQCFQWRHIGRERGDGNRRDGERR